MRLGILKPLGALLLLAGGTSCGTLGYYGQAVGGQMEIWQKQRPNEIVINDPATSEGVKKNLILVGELLDFAHGELGLPVTGSYERYADLERAYVVWSVFACEEFSLKNKTWWYPVVGNLSYRGYFNEASAKKTGSELKEQGYDVFVGGVAAYSTLGWFNDPVLNTFIKRRAPLLAELIFHEMAHQLLYFAGDTDFNEAFAQAVAEDGVRRWLRSTGQWEALSNYETSLVEQERLLNVIHAGQRKLGLLYETSLPEAQKRKQKKVIFDEMIGHYERGRKRGGKKQSWFSGDLNNAHLSVVTTYRELIGDFQHQMAKHPDLKSFYQAMLKMKRFSPDARRVALKGE